MNIRKTLGIAMLLLALFAPPALAVDGVLEINQAKVLAGGVNPDDLPGFPVTIDQPGSYRLTGNLTVPGGLEGLRILADDITVDLNGFTIAGGGGAIADGIGIYGTRNIEIRNGTVRGFSRAGVFASAFATGARVLGVRALSNFQGLELQGVGSLVDGCTAVGNSTGIRVLDGGLITNSVARGNTSFGLLVEANSGYGGNVVTGNNGGDANAQIAGTGVQIAPNVCGTDAVCP
ncbi:MAG TPA: hypothetical protein VFV75_17755 [Candidatus Polarisedimenticolaceae bacterium]|nr:hypothetical protein [Candidatus Polarisedimenticolaceae bacterium]